MMSQKFHGYTRDQGLFRCGPRHDIILLTCILLALVYMLSRHQAPPLNTNSAGIDVIESDMSQMLDDITSKVEELSHLLEASSHPASITTDGSRRGHMPSTHAPNSSPSLNVYSVHTVDNITYSEFQKYSNPFTSAPLKVTNSMTHDFQPEKWTLEGFRDICGHRSIYNPLEGCDSGTDRATNWDCHNVRYVDLTLVGKEWAGMKIADIHALGISTIGDFLTVQARTPGLYIHDPPLYQLCPEAIETFKAPKFFPTSYEEITFEGGTDPEENASNKYYPSIFAGSANSHTMLHADARMTRFWIFQLTGRKLIRMLPPSENYRGHAGDSDMFLPTLFRVDIINPDFTKYPDSNGMLVYEAILSAGEWLYIPSGWGHEVHNLEFSIATSMNVIEENSFDLYFRETRENMPSGDDASDHVAYRTHIDDAMMKYTAFYLPLVHPSENIGNIAWADLHESHVLERAKLPLTVVKFVESMKLQYPGEPPSRWRDKYGRRPLEIAVRHNFVAVVKYLIDEIEMDATQEVGGLSLADIASALDYEIMTDYLIESGSKLKLKGRAS